MSSWAPLRRSAPSICRGIGIQRFNIRMSFNQARVSASSSSSDVIAALSIEDDKSRDTSFGLFFKSVSAIVVGSGLGFWLWSSSALPSFSFADLSSTITTGNVASKKDDPNQHSVLHDAVHEKKPKFIFGDAFRRNVFFKYEKRLRMRSPPEKIFEYFASVRTPEGVVLMTPADLMRAIVPVFPPSESNLVREGYLRGERCPSDLRCAPSTFFMLFDINNDGLISFAEYIFFVTLLSIPESSFSVAFKMFDHDNSGEIDREEFKKVMALMRAQNRQGAQHRDGSRLGLKVGTSAENGGLLEFFFGKDGKSCLQHGKFVEFLGDLRDEILHLEFAHYDYMQRGTISAKDFAMSMVTSADISHISKFLNRVDELNNEPHLRDIRITLEEFKAFAELRKRLQQLSLAIFSHGKVNGLLTRTDFQRATSNVCGVCLTDAVVDIIFHMFDTNRDGNLSANEFLKVLHRREMDIAQPTTEAGVVGMILCWLNCTKNCSPEQVRFFN